MKYQTGALKNTKDNRDIKYRDLPATAVSLPSKHITDISMIPVLDQGPLGTCVAHAMATVKMYQEYKETGVVPKFSRRFLYSIARTYSPYGPDMGLFPRDGAKVVQGVGMLEPDTIDDNTLPHNLYIQFVPTAEQKTGAGKWKAGYTSIDNGDLQTIKAAIVREGVVTISLAFQGSKWSSRTGKVSAVDGKLDGLHYITLYGYEDDGNDTIFYFRNSWSKDWGKKGNGQFNWSDYRTRSYDAIAFADVPNDLIEKAKNTQYLFTTTMKKGMTTPEVKKLQERLKDEGYYTYPQITGYFGGVTETAVIAYQKAKGLKPADGIVGPVTREMLNRPVVLKKNSASAMTVLHSLSPLKLYTTVINLLKRLWSQCSTQQGTQP